VRGVRGVRAAESAQGAAQVRRARPLFEPKNARSRAAALGPSEGLAQARHISFCGERGAIWDVNCSAVRLRRLLPNHSRRTPNGERIDACACRRGTRPGPIDGVGPHAPACRTGATLDACCKFTPELEMSRCATISRANHGARPRPSTRPRSKAQCITSRLRYHTCLEAMRAECRPR